ncbi:MAG: type IX secretion system membrane protein PorP/SprF [Bacteroidaceae bacterium]|nr:type IX secretion system membrane protein PorP/SprF [Bacteroidaceae bacterium]MBP3245164.1 type IX secretion system membrane protein PorP/SprF [Bacteroidaceae bacterium]
MALCSCIIVVRKFLLLILTAVCISSDLQAQYDVHFSNYWALDPYYNPASSGLQNRLNVTAAVAMQMLGVENAPKSLHVGADMPMPLLPPEHGVGVNFFTESIGMFSHQRLAIQYAYHGMVGKIRLSGGVQAGMISEKFNPTDIEFGEAESDPAFPSSEVDGNAIDLSAGIRADYNGYWLSLSAKHLNSPKILLGENNELKVSPSYYLLGGCNIQLNNPFISIQPSLMVMSDATALRADITLRATYKYDEKRFYGGVGYSPTNSFTVLLGGDIGGVSVGYAYEAYTSALGAANGSHELVLGFQTDLNLFKKGKNKHKSVRIL